MNLPGLSISRHVLAASLSVVILLCGLLGFMRIGVDRMPDVEFPVVSVVTPVPGVAPETIAKTVTQVLESNLNTIAGIDEISSTSSQGVSMITVRFDDNKDLQEAFSDVQTKVQGAVRQLPSDALASTISKFDMGAMPVLWLSLSGGTDIQALSRKALDVRRMLETVSGVGQVQVVGDLNKTLNITVDDAQMAALGVTYSDIKAAFARNHLQLAGGTVKTPGRDFQVKMEFEFSDLESLSALPVALKKGVSVRLKDIAHLSYAPEESRAFARFQGEQSVSLGVIKVSGSNSVAVIDAVTRRLDDVIIPSLEAPFTLAVAQDLGEPIRQVVGALQDHLIEGTLLTALVVFLFLKSVRATLIVATAIPVSLAGAVAGMYFAGYTFNTFTLLAMLLLIGTVVDDAIVMLEAAFLKKEQNPDMSMEQAARLGSSQVMFAVMAATLTLVSIFAPVAFMDGTLGKFFKSFAIVVTLGVMVSWFVSMTLTPMLCARYLRVNSSAGPVARTLEVGLSAMNRSYERLLGLSLTYRKTVLLVAALTLVPTAGMMGSVKKAFSPDANDGRIAVQVTVPAGIPKATLLAKMEGLEAIARSEPSIEMVLSSFRESGADGTERAQLELTMRDGTHLQQSEVMKALESAFSTVAGVKTSVGRGSGGGGRGGSLQFSLRGANYEELAAAAASLEQSLRAIDGMRSISSDLNLSSPQATVALDRVAAARLGVDASDVAFTLSAMTGEAELGKYSDADGERYPITLRSKHATMHDNPQALSHAYVKGNGGVAIRLSDVISITAEGAPSAVKRLSQQYAVGFSGSPSLSLGEAVSLINTAVAELPAGIEVAYSGQSKEFQKIGKTLGVTLLLAIVMLYLVLASQFNSYAQPLLVMMAQPLAVIGGVGALWLTGHSLNIFSMIGLILLLGLVAKNSILLVDRANQLRAEAGLSAHEAIALASPERLRPVIMTSLTVILTMLPAAFGLGAGAENNAPMAVAIIGGMTSSTLLTLVVVPAAYSLFSRKAKRSVASPEVTAQPE